MDFSKRLIVASEQSVGDRVGAFLKQPRRLSDPGMTCHVYFTSSGYLERVLWNVPASPAATPSGVDMAGTGSHTDRATAELISICEAIERYSSCAVPRGLLQARALDIADQVIDYESFPSCSEEEMSTEACTYRPLDPDCSIRWAKGTEVSSGRNVYIPAQMVWLHYPYSRLEGSFTTQVSTGCATHSDFNAALFAGLSEVLERDLIAVAWLKRLPLRAIDADLESIPIVGPMLADLCRSPGSRIQFFDGTTEFGLAIVYAYYHDPSDNNLANVVICATGTSYIGAITKCLRELSASLLGMRNRIDTGVGVAGNVVFDGALEMARTENTLAFDFLSEANGVVSLDDLERSLPGELDWHSLTRRVLEAGHSIYYVDISTPESLSFGLHVVKVLVPTLMPLSFDRGMQFHAHPRLQQLSSHFGVDSLNKLNPYPQPFA